MRYQPVLSIEFIENRQKWQSHIFRFENGYGASVQSHKGNYGYKSDLWELAVIIFLSDDPHDFDLVYNTSITDDVLGWLTYSKAMTIVYKIAHLPQYVPVEGDRNCIWELDEKTGISTKRTYGEELCQSVTTMTSSNTSDTPLSSPDTVTKMSLSNVVNAIVSYTKKILQG